MKLFHLFNAFVQLVFLWYFYPCFTKRTNAKVE